MCRACRLSAGGSWMQHHENLKGVVTRRVECSHANTYTDRIRKIVHLSPIAVPQRRRRRYIGVKAPSRATGDNAQVIGVAAGAPSQCAR